MNSVLVDTGPLVAMLRTTDINHTRCVEVSKSITAPLLTSWPVLTEAAYLLRKDLRHVLALLRYVEEEELDVADLPPKASRWFTEFFHCYSDHEPQLADASLVYLAEQESITDIFTLDRRDFSYYRLPQGRALNILD